jgi:hypothetical protein
VALLGILLASIAILVKQNSSRGTVLSRIFQDSRDPDEPTEEEENARNERAQFFPSSNIGFGTKNTDR